MDRLQKTLTLLLVAGIPAAAPPFFAAPASFCFTAGSVTYQVAPTTTSPDLRVRIDNAAAQPDLRIQVVDAVESADFALVDDVADAGRSACRSDGLLKTVKVVDSGTADVTISLSREAAEADLKLFVHSARLGHRDAAALLAAMRHKVLDGKVALSR
jgi:hypothetical protein